MRVGWADSVRRVSLRDTVDEVVGCVVGEGFVLIDRFDYVK